MRIIIILLVMIFVYILAKSLLSGNKKKSKKNKMDIKYCKYCKAYVTSDVLCSDKNNNYRNCKNYKWDIYE